MKGVPILLCGIGLMAGFAQAEEPSRREATSRSEASATRFRNDWPVDIELLSSEWQETIAKVVNRPTMTAQAPSDSFAVNDELYRWMLDHPDRVALAWRRMRVPAVEITPLDANRFSWKDDQGSELVWRTVVSSAAGRIWYAEGKIKPGALLPLVPVRVVAALHHQVERDRNGRTIVRHRLDAYLQTDSKFANLVTKLLGPAGPKLAEEGAEQLLYFFSGVSRYVDKNPDKAPTLLAGKK